MSLSDFAELALLNALRGTTYAAAATYVKLHTADPGEAGTTAAATETTRKAATFSAASAGSMSMSGTLAWTTVAATETYTHFSVWDASTAGNCLGSGALSASAAMTAGDNFNLTALTWSLD